MRLQSLVLVAIVLLGGSASPAFAQKPDEESKRWYEQGTKHYNLGEFDEAIAAYRKGYDAKPDPVFLFNIGQAYRLSGNLQQAVFFYKSFLRNMPAAPNREEVERRIKEMEDQLRQQDRSVHVPPPSGAIDPGENSNTNDRQRHSPDLAPAPAAAPNLSVAPPPPSVGDPPLVAVDASSSKDEKKLHQQWWFWGGIGVAVAATAVIIAVVTLGGGGGKPDTDYPPIIVF